MRNTILSLSAAILVSGCVYPPDANLSSNSVYPVVSNETPSELQQASFTQSRSDTAEQKTKNNAGSQSSNMTATPAHWPWQDCDCEREMRDDPNSIYNQLLTQYRQLALEHEYLLEARRVVKESFKYVELKWIKKSLYNICKSNRSAYSTNDCDRLLSSSAYDDTTAKMVSSFQCIHYEVASDGTCDSFRTTGWITFPEARQVVCKSGFSAIDDTNILLADWYANGRVFRRDLPIAHWLIKKLKANLKIAIENNPPPAVANLLRDYEADARLFEDRLISVIESEEDALGREIVNTAEPFDPVKYDESEICVGVFNGQHDEDH